MSKYIGVENTNGNRYEETITVEDFMSKIDLSKVENSFVRRVYERFLAIAACDDVPIEHVDTYKLPEGGWRVQLRLAVDQQDIPDNWFWIQDFMNYAESSYNKYIQFRVHFSEGRNAFYAVMTFTVPAKNES